MDDYPDIYTDGFSITAGAFGVTITLSLSQPTGEPGPHDEPTDRVGRVRLSRELARVLADQLSQLLAMAGQASATGSTIKH